MLTRDWPAGLIDRLWILWVLYWLLAARSVKPVRRCEPLTSRLSYVLLALLGGLLLSLAHVGSGWLQTRLIGGGWTRYEIALALIIAGLSFSVWVRHPIYTGLLMAVFGSGLAAGRLYDTVAFILITLSLLVKLRVEERWMAAEFGERYEQYRRSSWALIPFVF